MGIDGPNNRRYQSNRSNVLWIAAAAVVVLLLAGGIYFSVASMRTVATAPGSIVIGTDRPASSAARAPVPSAPVTPAHN